MSSIKSRSDFFELHARNPSCPYSAERVKKPETGVGIAKSFRPYVGDAVTICIGARHSRLPGQIDAHAVWRRQTWPLTNQNNNHVGMQRAPDCIADRNAALMRNDERSNRKCSVRKAGKTSASSGWAWVCTARADNPSAITKATS